LQPVQPCVQGDFSYKLDLVKTNGVVAATFTQNSSKVSGCGYTFTWDSVTQPVLGMTARYTIAPASAAVKASYQTVTGVAFSNNGTVSALKSASADAISSASFSAPVDLLNYQVVYQAAMTNSSCLESGTYSLTLLNADGTVNKKLSPTMIDPTESCYAPFPVQYIPTTNFTMSLTPDPSLSNMYLTKTINFSWTDFVAVNGVPTFTTGLIPAQYSVTLNALSTGAVCGYNNKF
jgi:hypothetical protein